MRYSHHSKHRREPECPITPSFASQDAHDAARSPHINTNQFFNTALAVGDAKAWSRNLDRKTQDGGDPFNNQNPNYQIDSYLRDADKDWGILTNGRQWRLYHRQTSYRLDSFYEVDLAALLSENRDLDAFRYFYNLFRRDAFIPDPSGAAFLDHVLGESQQYTVGVSDDLKNRVYDVLRRLIGGFLDFPRNGFDRANPPLDEIQTNCLILLYRVLFILYAESRDLLPLDNRDYAMQYSLDHLATDIHENWMAVSPSRREQASIGRGCGSYLRSSTTVGMTTSRNITADFLIRNNTRSLKIMGLATMHWHRLSNS